LSAKLPVGLLTVTVIYVYVPCAQAHIAQIDIQCLRKRVQQLQKTQKVKFFLISKKRKIRILEHWSYLQVAVSEHVTSANVGANSMSVAATVKGWMDGSEAIVAPY